MHTVTPIIIPMSTGSSEPSKCPHCGKELPSTGMSFKEFLIILGVVFLIFWGVWTGLEWMSGNSGYSSLSLLDVIVGQVKFVFKLLKNIK